MSRVLAISIFAFAWISIQALPQQPPASAPATGAIEGTVVRSDTGGPVAGAQVLLTITTLAQPGAAAALANTAQRAITYQPVLTGPDGKFTFKDVVAGAYRIAATADGFVRQEHGQRAINGQGRVVFVTPGQTLKDTAIRLIPTGTVTGRVLDENGQPATGAPIQLVRATYSTQGRSLGAVGAAYVDDRGEYRVHGVPPGRYYVLAGTPAGGAALARGAGGPVSNSRFSLLYYPNAPDIEQAALVDVKSGTETGADMKLRRQVQSYRVRGRVIDGTGAGLPANLGVTLGYRFLNASGSVGTGPAINPATGTFELQNVFPGDYVVMVQPPLPSQQAVPSNPNAQMALAARQAAQATMPSAKSSIRVVDKDVEDVVITISTGVIATGRFTLEGQPITALPNLDQMRLGFLQPSPGIGSPPVGFPAGVDGTFEVVGLREGEYRVQVAPMGLIPGFFVKSVRYGGEDVFSKIFKFSGSGAGTFEVVLRAGAGQVGGTVTDARSQPVAGIQVFLVPAVRGRVDLYKSGTTDQTGRFSITGLAPGEYKAFSWEGLDNGAQFDPDFLKQHETLGKAIPVTEGATANVDVKLISVQ